MLLADVEMSLISQRPINKEVQIGILSEFIECFFNYFSICYRNNSIEVVAQLKIFDFQYY